MIEDNIGQQEPLSFNGYYDLDYLIDDQTVVFHDKVNELYHYMVWERFSAFIKAHYYNKETAENVLYAVLNFRKVRIIPSQQVAGIKPLMQPDFINITLDILNKTVGMEFQSENDKRRFYLENWGINLL
jgi:hypothetical protein